ncbi:hypothetical protein H6758_02990 [Candidatus Nomurabacteria bacterium]|nr:hypothetical protein [Candidatus Nomurabacteria bacterium]
MTPKNATPSFLGLDFLVDKTGKVYFNEINSFPGFFIYHHERLPELFDLITGLVDHYGKDIVLIYSKKKFFQWTKQNLRFRRLSELTDGQARMCIVEDPNNVASDLRDIFGQKVKHGVIFTSSISIKKQFQKRRGFSVINSIELSEFVRDKWKVHEFFAKYAPEICQPKTFLLSQKIAIGKSGLKRLVLKPRYGMGGEGVIFTTKGKLESVAKQKGIVRSQYDQWIVQEVIVARRGLKAQEYYDVRSYLMNLHYVNAFMRTSTSQVVGISQGGCIRALPKKEKAPIEKASALVADALKKYLVY